MLVYGDHAFDATLESLLHALRRRLKDGSDAQTCREALILAGQIEQALADHDRSDQHAQALAALESEFACITDVLADQLVSLNTSDATHGPGWTSVSSSAIQGIFSRADRSTLAGRLQVKVPEGYAFYNLYPDQYVHSARAWSSVNAAERPGPTLVVGVRSIGTGLSAVAAAALRRDGWKAERATVRPSGHPFDRSVQLTADAIAANRFALVVDEGPGLSGSSMAAVARALLEAGLDKRRIAFLPGHRNGPGPAAAPQISEMWRCIPQFTADPERCRLGESDLLETLRRRSSELLRAQASTTPDFLGAGAWRRAVWPDERNWPAVAPAFERTKFRFSAPGRGSIIWKFGGLAVGPTLLASAELERSRLARLSADGWCPEPLDSALGFLASRWIEGDHASREANRRSLLPLIGRYIAAGAGEPMDDERRRSAFNRVRGMLHQNTLESLGGPWASASDRIAHSAERALTSARPCPSAADDRMAPHEWVRTEGRWTKTDAGGPTLDHTLVGVQPITWDIAATIVEWDLDHADTEPLMEPIERNLPKSILERGLPFHIAAYAALRVGVMTFAAELAAGTERSRAEAARGHYLARLRRTLAASRD